jgi:hypothetical protein
MSNRKNDTKEKMTPIKPPVYEIASNIVFTSLKVVCT